MFFGFLIGVAFCVWLWYATMRRGLRAVRAYVYIEEYVRTQSVEQANAEAFRVTPTQASDIAEQAMRHAAMHYRGKQLEMIAGARNAGFRG